MITAPESNIVLTDEQTAAIEESKSILLNLETEITRASRVLNVTKNDIIQATTDKEYAQGQVDALNQQKSDIEDALVALQKEVDSATSTLESLKQESSSISESHTLKEQELSERESAVKETESAIITAQAALLAEQQSVIADRLLVNQAKDAFTTAVAAVVWN